MAGSGQAIAGGILADAVDGLCGDCGLGEVVEDAQRKIMQAFPISREAEEVIAKGIERLEREGIAESAAPLICAAIRESRDSAQRAGTQPIPKDLYDQLSFYFGSELLNRIEYRIGEEGDLSLQTVFFPLGVTALTLDHVIVFRSRTSADDLWLWAHELGHVQQVERSGLDGFCAAYLQDFLALEEEADRVADDLTARRRTVGAGSW
jgi:hypothetical protein